jgi:hypothetical protein
MQMPRLYHKFRHGPSLKFFLIRESTNTEYSAHFVGRVFPFCGGHEQRAVMTCAGGFRSVLPH